MVFIVPDWVILVKNRLRRMYTKLWASQFVCVDGGSHRMIGPCAN